jgi:hypothetical protein
MAQFNVTGFIPVTLLSAPSAIDVDENKHAHILHWVGALFGAPPPPWTFSHDIGEGAATEAMINLCVQAHTHFGAPLHLTLVLDNTGPGATAKIMKVTIQ